MAHDSRHSTGTTAGYFHTYTTIAPLPTVHGCSAVQGFAADADDLYSVKVGLGDTRAVLYRTDRATGATTLLTNGTDALEHNPWLGHANDLAIVHDDGATHLFVVTMATSGAQLVRLRCDRTAYYRDGSYAIELDGEPLGVAGISVLAQDDAAITFWLKSGRHVYTGRLPRRSDSGTIALTRSFDLGVTGALVDGRPVPDLDTFVNQGFHYDPDTRVGYYPLTKHERSIVLVYRDVTADSSGTLTPAPDLSFRVTSSAFPRNFEIESVALSGGRLYFNTNRAASKAAAEGDGVHYFHRYTSHGGPHGQRPRP